MDRNNRRLGAIHNAEIVALRKESVDRNLICGSNRTIDIMSLSARRAWIEILASRLTDMSDAWSLSARRAWIEIK